MTFKEFISKYEWYSDYLQSIDIIKDDSMMNEMLSVIWFNFSRGRATEEEIMDFYKSNILYSAQLISKLPMDNEVSLKSIAEANHGYIQDIASLFRHTHKSVIDYGCGIGQNGVTFAYYGYDVTLYDVQSPHFKVAADLARQFLNFNTTYDNKHSRPIGVGWLNHGHFVNKITDIIICVQVLEHIKDPIDKIKQFYDILNDGGLLILETFFSDNVPYHLSEHVENHLNHPAYWHRTMIGIGFRPLIKHEDGEVRVWIKC